MVAVIGPGLFSITSESLVAGALEQLSKGMHLFSARELNRVCISDLCPVAEVFDPSGYTF